MDNGENAYTPPPPQWTGDNNGLNFCGSNLPENVVELILTKVGDADIINCVSVCQAWRKLITRKSLWKKRFEDKKINWNHIPKQILDKPGGWRVFNDILRNEILSKNYIKNSSGHDQFEGWTIISERNHQCNVEEEPIGCDPLPDLPFFGVNDRSCFVPASSCKSWCSKYYLVDLWAEGLTLNLMKQLLPFKIKCSQSYTASLNLGGDFQWELMLLTSQERVLSDYLSPVTRLPPGSVKWRTAECNFNFGRSNAIMLRDLRYVLFIHEGRCSGAGRRYGMKLSRSCVTIECLEPMSRMKNINIKQLLENMSTIMGVPDRVGHIKLRNVQQRLMTLHPFMVAQLGLWGLND